MIKSNYSQVNMTCIQFGSVLNNVNYYKFAVPVSQHYN